MKAIIGLTFFPRYLEWATSDSCTWSNINCTQIILKKEDAGLKASR